MTWLAVLSVLRRVPNAVWFALALVVCLGAYGHWSFNRGVLSERRAQLAERAREIAAASALKAKRAEASAKVEVRYIDRIKVVREKGETIFREVTRYVPSDACPLPPGWRVLHDAAAQGRLPDPAAVAVAAPVPAQDAARTVASNYTTCHATEEQLRALIEWHKSQAAIR